MSTQPPYPEYRDQPYNYQGPPQPPAYGGPPPMQPTVGYQPVVSTQPTGGTTYIETKPNNYLGLSIFSCLCCCWIFGVIALIQSFEVDSAWGRGDYEGSRRASQSAKTWNMAAIIVGSIIAGIVVLLFIIGAASGS